MASESKIQELAKSFQGSGKTFAEFISEIFKDKFVEIYVGDSYEQISTEQISTTIPAVFCGKVIAAYKECLIVNGIYTKYRKHHLGNITFINERAIRALTEIDECGTLEEMFLRSRESINIRNSVKE